MISTSIPEGAGARARPARRAVEDRIDAPGVVELLESLEHDHARGLACWICGGRGNCSMPLQGRKRGTGGSMASRRVACPRCNRAQCLQDAGFTQEDARRSAMADVYHASHQRTKSMQGRAGQGKSGDLEESGDPGEGG